MATPIGGEADRLPAAGRLAADRVPDVVVPDLGLPDASGLEAVRTIKEHLPTTWMLVVSAQAGA